MVGHSKAHPNSNKGHTASVKYLYVIWQRLKMEDVQREGNVLRCLELEHRDGEARDHHSRRLGRQPGAQSFIRIGPCPSPNASPYLDQELCFKILNHVCQRISAQLEE